MNVKEKQVTTSHPQIKQTNQYNHPGGSCGITEEVLV